MSLDVITAGGDIEVIFFWSFGAVILGIGAVESWYKARYLDEND